MTLVQPVEPPARGNPAATRAEDEILVSRMLAGEEEAFNDFAATYFAPLYRFALRRLSGDGELTRELVQITVCKAIRKLDTFRGEASLFTWLRSCCRNEILMHFRRKSSAPVEVELDEGSPATLAAGRDRRSEQPELRLLRDEVASRVHQALDLLPQRYAKALEWKYLDRLTVREIAGRLEITAKAAESVMSRARAAFKEHYDELAADRGRPHTDAARGVDA